MERNQERGQERNLERFVNAFIPFIEEICEGVIDRYTDDDLVMERGDGRDRGRQRRSNREDDGDDREPGGQGRVKDPEHDRRLKDNQPSETPYQKFSAASRQEIRQAREERSRH